MSRRVCVFFILALYTFFSSAALAQPKKPIDPLALYNEAQNLYEQQKYEEALARFQELYALSEKPQLLFKVGQCYQGLHRYQEALEAYRSALPYAPDAQSRLDLEKLIQEMEAEVAKNPTKPALVPQKPEEPPNKFHYTLPIAFAGVGTGLGLGALILRGQIKNLQEQFLEDGGPVFDDGTIFRRRFALAAGADLSFAAAGVSFILIRKQTSVAVAPTTGGAVLSLGYSLGGPL